MSNPTTSTMDVDPNATATSLKRSVIVDPDSKEPLQESKKPRIELDVNKKERCLTLLVEGFQAILSNYFPIMTRKGIKDKDAESILMGAYANLPVSIQLANIIFTLHTYNRQVAAGRKDTNVIKKSEKTEFTLNYLGQKLIRKRDDLLQVWNDCVHKVGLEYKNYGRDDGKENWYGTFGPYIDFCCGFGLRMKELRLGHDKMPMSKQDDVMQEFPVKKYGLNRAHHIRLEGPMLYLAPRYPSYTGTLY